MLQLFFFMGDMMKNESLWQFLKFTFFSVLAAGIQAGSFALFNDLLVWGYWPSYLVSLLLTIIWSFTVNRRYTFKSATNVPVAMMKLLGFYAVFTPLSTWLGALAEAAGVHDYVVLIVTMLVNFILEFLFSKYIMYGKNAK